jgi:Trk-type K+ transport system membrane component
MDLTTKNIVYYGAYAPLLMIAMLSIILGIIYLVFYKRFKHKEIIDIIYER